MKFLFMTVFWLAVAVPAVAGHLHPEKFYQIQFCAGRGEMEVVMDDGTRVDCLTETHAIEVDFARKWYEGVMQALHYARLTGKRAAVALIIESPEDEKYFRRMREDIEFYRLPVDTISISADWRIR